MTENEFLEQARKVINPDISKRLPPKVREVLKNGNYVFDNHVHVFDKSSVNEGYFLLRSLAGIVNNIFLLARVADRQSLFTVDFKSFKASYEPFRQQAIENLYKKIENDEPLPSWDEIEKDFEAQEQFFEENKLFTDFATQKVTKSFFRFLLKVFFKTRKFADIYDDFINRHALTVLDRFKGKELISTVLMMDFYDEWKKLVKKPLWDQIDEFNALADQQAILPFFAIDPRRADDSREKENLYHLFLKAFDKSTSRFFGVKFYPALGYSPSDYRLDPIFKICNEFSIPVVTHCGGEIVSTFRNKVTIFNNFDRNDSQVVPGTNRKERAYFLNDPERWSPVLAKYNNLRINLAHFGGSDAWMGNPQAMSRRVQTITDFMKIYPQVHSDFAFNLIDSDTFKNFVQTVSSNPLVASRTMYGTDYWVVLFAGDLLREQKAFFDTLAQQGGTLIQSMTVAVPGQFYFGNSAV